MASIVQKHVHHKVRFVGGDPFTITLPSPLTAGNKVVVFAAGGAIPTIRLTDGSGSLFSEREPYGGGAMYTSFHDVVAAGGETVLHVDLNGEENISFVILECNGLGNFVDASGNGAGASPSSSTDLKITAGSAITVSTKSVMFSGFTAQVGSAVRPFNATNRWRQLGPSGKLEEAGANQPGANTEFIYSLGISDVEQTSKYPLDLATGNFAAKSIWLSGDVCFAVQAVYENAGADIVEDSTAILKENLLPGSHINNWFAPSNKSASINGYTDKTSYLPGETVNFKVDSLNNPFRVEIYRLGYYGWETIGARNVLDSFVTGSPAAQPSPTVDPVLGSTHCTWSTTASWTIPADATSGVYFCLFRRTDQPGEFSSGLFVVKDDDITDKIVIVLPFCTYQAYNVWGATTDNGEIPNWSGRSLYQIGNQITPNVADRAYAVSFDRPYSTNSTQENTWIFDAEYGVINFLEAQGYDLSYVTDIDLELDPSVLIGAKIVMSLGHHEYWTSTQYDAFENVGTNIMWVSSNTALWHTRFAAGDSNKRTMICYKDSTTTDVSPGFTGTGLDPVSYTGTWRDTRGNGDIRREDSLTGQLFKVSAPVAGTFDVGFDFKDLPIWRNSPDIQALTSGQTYDTVVTNMGDELDYFDEASSTKQTNIVKLCPTVASYNNGANAAGTIYTTVTGNIEFGFTLHKSGTKLVFNTGSWRGFNGVSRFRLGAYSTESVIDINWQNALIAILQDLGSGEPPRLIALRQGDDPVPSWSSISNVEQSYGLQSSDSSYTMMFFF